MTTAESPWKLTDAELRKVEKDHREMTAMGESEPIRMALKPGVTKNINGTTYTIVCNSPDSRRMW